MKLSFANYIFYFVSGKGEKQSRRFENRHPTQKRDLLSGECSSHTFVSVAPSVALTQNYYIKYLYLNKLIINNSKFSFSTYISTKYGNIK